ncbi:hypothetical protein [Arcicella aurantiaca]|nr:hypothetical protein [Arcicella aurantiaca]
MIVVKISRLPLASDDYSSASSRSISQNGWKPNNTGHSPEASNLNETCLA